MTIEDLPPTATWGGINHLALVTPDMDATVRFYAGVLGMPLVATLMAGPMRHYFFEMGNGNTIAFFEVPTMATFAKPAGASTDRTIQFDHLSFDVPNEESLELLRVRLASAGSEVTVVVDHGIMKSIYFTDPNGIALEASVWRIDTKLPRPIGDPESFLDPNPVAAVLEMQAGGLDRLVVTKLT